MSEKRASEYRNYANGNMPLISTTLVEQAVSPSSPTSGNLKVYAKSDGKLYTMDSDGIENEIGGSSSVEYVYARPSAEVAAANTTIPVTIALAGNISIANNMFNLKLGITYELEACMEFRGDAGMVWAEYIWTDSSGVQLSASNIGISIPVQSLATDSETIAKAVITPSQDMSVKVMTTNIVSNVTGLAPTRSYFKITQIGSTARTLNSGTEAQRIAMSPTVGYEFYQTDAGEGKYIYTNGKWCQISGLSYLIGYKTVASSVTTGTIINFVVRDSFNMGTITPPSIPLKAGKTYEIHAFTQIDGSAPAGARFAFVNAVGETEIIALNHGVSYTSTFTGHVGPQPVAGGFYTPSADIDLKLKCISISGSPELAYESFRLEVKQIS